MFISNILCFNVTENKLKGAAMSARKSGCIIKNGECVPRCSDLTPEEIAKGAVCETGGFLIHCITKEVIN